MGIQDSANRIKNNVVAAYAEAAKKGGTIPAQQTSDNLAGAIASIPSGGGGGGGTPEGFSHFDVIFWTPAADVRNAEIEHSLGVLPDGFHVVATERPVAQSTRTMLVSGVDVQLGRNGQTSSYVYGRSVATDGFYSEAISTGLFSDYASETKITTKSNGNGYFRAGLTYQVIVYKRQ